jgi:hypothetical protein
MVELKAKRTVRWAGVEFQPNLLKPCEPIRLGAILLETTTEWQALAVIGRMPRINSPPPEFQEVSDITMRLAASWVDSMFKDILEGDGDNLFDLLSKRWRWNLYLIEPKALNKSQLAGSTIETIAKQQYATYVGEPFEPAKVKAPTRQSQIEVPLNIPPPWQLEELKRQSLLAAA